MRRLLPYDELLGIRRVFNIEDEDDHWSVHTEQDVTELIELNKAEFNLHNERSTWKGNGPNRVARIPIHIYMYLVRTGIAQDEQAFGRWLENWAAWRTRPGKLSR